MIDFRWNFVGFFTIFLDFHRWDDNLRDFCFEVYGVRNWLEAAMGDPNFSAFEAEFVEFVCKA